MNLVCLVSAKRKCLCQVSSVCMRVDMCLKRLCEVCAWVVRVECEYTCVCMFSKRKRNCVLYECVKFMCARSLVNVCVFVCVYR